MIIVVTLVPGFNTIDNSGMGASDGCNERSMDDRTVDNCDSDG